MAERDDDLLGQAIANTEKEIWASAMDEKEAVLDESGDRTPEQMGEGLEGQIEPEDDADDAGEEAGESKDAKGDDRERDPETGKFKAKDNEGLKGDKPGEPAKPEAKDGPATDEPKGRVPPARLREETQKRTTETARADAAEQRASKAETDLAALNAKLDGILVAMRAPQQQPQPQPKAEPREAPDMFLDPVGYAQWNKDQVVEQVSAVTRQFQERFVEGSFADAHETHKEGFERAYQAISSLDRMDPGARATVQKIWNDPNPGRALMRWHRQIETIREVGDDPTAYAEKIRTATREALLKDPEVRRQILEDLRAEAEGGDNGKPRTVTRLPKSLNGAGGGSQRSVDARDLDGSERAIFDSALTD